MTDATTAAGGGPNRASLVAAVAVVLLALAALGTYGLVEKITSPPSDASVADFCRALDRLEVGIDESTWPEAQQRAGEARDVGTPAALEGPGRDLYLTIVDEITSSASAAEYKRWSHPLLDDESTPGLRQVERYAERCPRQDSHLRPGG